MKKIDHRLDLGELAHWVAAPMKDVGTSEQFHEVVARAKKIIAARLRVQFDEDGCGTATLDDLEA